MSAYDYESLAEHVGHSVVIVVYGDEEIHNVAIECEDCNCVIHDIDFNTFSDEGNDEVEEVEEFEDPNEYLWHNGHELKVIVDPGKKGKSKECAAVVCVDCDSTLLYFDRGISQNQE